MHPVAVVAVPGKYRQLLLLLVAGLIVLSVRSLVVGGVAAATPLVAVRHGLVTVLRGQPLPLICVTLLNTLTRAGCVVCCERDRVTHR